jgi:hypothetical protein
MPPAMAEDGRGTRDGEHDDGADEPLFRGRLDELLRPPPPFDVTALLRAVREADVLPGVPLS